MMKNKNILNLIWIMIITYKKGCMGFMRSIQLISTITFFLKKGLNRSDRE